MFMNLGQELLDVIQLEMTQRDVNECIWDVTSPKNYESPERSRLRVF